jgi:hypothetical protein
MLASGGQPSTTQKRSPGLADVWSDTHRVTGSCCRSSHRHVAIVAIPCWSSREDTSTGFQRAERHDWYAATRCHHYGTVRMEATEQSAGSFGYVKALRARPAGGDSNCCSQRLQSDSTGRSESLRASDCVWTRWRENCSDMHCACSEGHGRVLRTGRAAILLKALVPIWGGSGTVLYEYCVIGMRGSGASIIFELINHR